MKTKKPWYLKRFEDLTNEDLYKMFNHMIYR